MTNPFLLLPAIDVRAGHSVRLSQGVVQTTSGSPLEQGLDFVNQGATWLHLVDLDAAYGVGNNHQVLADVISSLTIPVQLSGGIADEQSLNSAMALNPARINISAAALENLEWLSSVIAQYGDRVCVGVDVDGQHISPRGSTPLPLSLSEALRALSEMNCRRVVVTDVRRDGSLEGPNLDLLKQVASSIKAAVVASGGVAGLDDIDALRALGIEGAIIGKALYAGRFTFVDAKARAEGHA